MREYQEEHERESVRLAVKDGQQSTKQEALHEGKVTCQEIIDMSKAAMTNARKEQKVLTRSMADQTIKDVCDRDHAVCPVIGTLVSGIAHGLNNILMAVIGNAELVLTLDDLPENVGTGVKTILNEGKRAAQITHQLVDYAGKSILHKKNLDLGRFLKEKAPSLSDMFPPNVQINVMVPSEHIPVCADPESLEQAVVNIAMNARDAMPEGGQFTINLSTEQFEAGTACAMPGGISPPGRAVMTISDTGVGMSPEILSCIYEPFFSAKPRGQRLGLGLSQAYGIIRQHEGSIDVRSQAGRGTTFHIWLPLCEARDITYETKRVLEHQSGHGEIVLIVEDEPVVLEVLRRMLEVLGYQCLPAKNADEALALCTSHGDISLVLSDVLMPGMSGIELFHILARDSSVKMILMSGYPMGHDEIPQGIAGWIQKPPTLRQLAQTIGAALTSEPIAEDHCRQPQWPC